MAMTTPYQRHWENLDANQAHFEAGDAAAITVFVSDARRIDPELSDQQAREALRILTTDTAMLDDILARHLPPAIEKARQQNP